LLCVVELLCLKEGRLKRADSVFRTAGGLHKIFTLVISTPPSNPLRRAVQKWVNVYHKQLCWRNVTTSYNGNYYGGSEKSTD